MGKSRIEKDSLGEIEVPAEALFGAQTQRAVENFCFSGTPLSPVFIRSLGLIKAAAAQANADLGLVQAATAEAIIDAAMAIAQGDHCEQFPVDVFQTGSGTSTNMNANEVIATLASRQLGKTVHPNDHVNCSQSSNDVIPTAIHVSAELALANSLLPAIHKLQDAISKREQDLAGIVKTGRTHLMDAMPLTFAQELSGWRVQLAEAAQRIDDAREPLRRLAQGGTAVGTGVNADPAFAGLFCAHLSELSGHEFSEAENYFAAISGQDTAVALSGQLRATAVTLMKIANDLRWMNSGPFAGLAEIRLKPLQPGSSIMPGKVNPVIPEAVAMAAAQVMGNDTTIGIAGQSGNFQLNVMLPLIAHNLHQSILLLSSSCIALAEHCINDFEALVNNIEARLSRNPILVTALNSKIGYARAAEIAKRAYQEDRDIIDVALEMTDLDAAVLAELLDPTNLV
jgi:fumarate hydratase, class II